jgi:hypothetical protein
MMFLRLRLEWQSIACLGRSTIFCHYSEASFWLFHGHNSSCDSIYGALEVDVGPEGLLMTPISIMASTWWWQLTGGGITRGRKEHGDQQLEEQPELIDWTAGCLSDLFRVLSRGVVFSAVVSSFHLTQLMDKVLEKFACCPSTREHDVENELELVQILERVHWAWQLWKEDYIQQRSKRKRPWI